MLLSFYVVYLQSKRMHDSRFSFLTCTCHDMNAQDVCTTVDVLESIHYMCKACSVIMHRKIKLQTFWNSLNA